MPLHDYNLANQTPASYRTDHNNLNLAIAGQNASSSGITTTFAHMLFADVSSSGWLRQRNAADSTFNYIMPLGVPGGLFTYSGNPSSNHAAKYQGQPLYDTANNALYIATLAGTSSQATWAQLQFSSSITQGLPTGYLAGPGPVYASAATLTIPGGLKCRDASDSADIEFSTNYTVDITVSGAGGLSTNLTEASNTWYYLFVIRKSGDGTINGILTTATSAPTLPSGYDQYRMLPFAVKNTTASDFLPFVTYQFDQNCSYIEFRDFEESATYQALNAGTSTQFTGLSLQTWMPGISRRTELQTKNSFVSNDAEAFLRPTGSGLSVGESLGSPNAGLLVTNRSMRTSTAQSIDYRITRNTATLSIWVKGLYITEVSS